MSLAMRAVALYLRVTAKPGPVDTASPPQIRLHQQRCRIDQGTTATVDHQERRAMSTSTVCRSRRSSGAFVARNSKDPHGAVLAPEDRSGFIRGPFGG